MPFPIFAQSPLPVKAITNLPEVASLLNVGEFAPHDGVIVTVGVPINLAFNMSSVNVTLPAQLTVSHPVSGVVPVNVYSLVNVFVVLQTNQSPPEIVRVELMPDAGVGHSTCMVTSAEASSGQPLFGSPAVCKQQSVPLMFTEFVQLWPQYAQTSPAPIAGIWKVCTYS